MTSVPADHGSRPARIVIIGAGPAGVMLLERIVANHQRDSAGSPLHIDLVDPFEPGGGRIWRRAQSPLLKLNSMLRDVTAFTDDSCRIDGPITTGPSLSEWVEQVRAGAIPRPEWHDAALDAEIDRIGPADFPTRRLNNGYLSWVTEEIVRRAGESASITWHQDRALRVEEATSGGGLDGAARHRVFLAAGSPLDADVVVHAIGHTGSAPSAESIRLQDFASRHNLTYIAPAFTADVDLSGIPAAEPVIVRGMGLAATDLIVLLTEGRGGRFETGTDGELRYIASRQEPLIHLGSGRGVPYRSKITSQAIGDPQHLEYLGESFHRDLSERTTALDFETDVWPLIAAEMLTGYYRELFTGHPDRVVGTWAEFHVELRGILQRPGGADSTALLALVRDRVPHLDDRFDLASFDRPLSFVEEGIDGKAVGNGNGNGEVSGASEAIGVSPVNEDEFAAHDTARLADGTAVHDRVSAHIAQDLRQRTSPEHSATQALFMTALFSYLSLTEVPAHQWNARSRTRTLPGRWHRTFSYLASGPPGHRLEELLALADAGIVTFLGGDLALDTSEDARAFVASGAAQVPLREDRRPHGGPRADAATASDTSTNTDTDTATATSRSTATAHSTAIARSTATARTLIDAWLPEAQARNSDNPYLRALISHGTAQELTVADAEYTGSTGQLDVCNDGRLPGVTAQFAIGPFTSLPTGGAFARPQLNSLPFRVHDRCARAVLAAAWAGVVESGVRASEVAAVENVHAGNPDPLDVTHQDEEANLWTDSSPFSNAPNLVSEEALSPQFSG